MTPLKFALMSALLCLISGVPVLLPVFPVGLARRISFGIVLAAFICGMTAITGTLLFQGQAEPLATAWKTPLGALQFRLDPLSAFFMIPSLLVGTAISLYCCGCYSDSSRRQGETVLPFFFGIILSSIIMLLLAGSGTTMLLFWEVMALSVFAAMVTEHRKTEVQEAGIQYLVASHVTVLVLIMMYAVLFRGGETVFPEPGSLDPATFTASAAMLMALTGFGLKAGIMPLHFWLPAAHANAPGIVSSFMSGIILKMGIYGLIRTLSFFSEPPLWWGILLVIAGIVSAVAGVLFALGQHDIKRLLAYHSIENIGIIVIGIGVALVGLSTDSRILFVLGMAGALLHVVNHALFKSLLFLGATAVIHAAGTRLLGLMGGMSRALPVTSVGFLVGAVAICGLPPLNGFVSELLIYLGIFNGFGVQTGSVASLMALAAVSLALTGGLAIACFVKVYGTVFLGAPRCSLPEPHEHPAMTSAMAVLAFCCALIGLFPFAAVQLLEPVLFSLFPRQGVVLPTITATAGLYGVSAMAAVLILAVILIFVWYVSRLKSTPVSASVTWDCGYAAPSSSMQYTASSFAAMLVDIFSGILRPERHEPDMSKLFPGQSRFHSHLPEIVLDRWIIPFFAAVDRRLSAVRRLQSGQLNRYLLYLFGALAVLLSISYFS
jgi:hydrogenase-4 component B